MSQTTPSAAPFFPPPAWHPGSGWRAQARSHWQATVAGPHRYLLLYSHMRSYSSLLAHVLGSSPEVQGYGETQVRYRHALDLWRLRSRIRQDTGEALHAPWLLDKVLHNPVRDLARHVGPERVRALVFVRRPEATLRSLLALAQRAVQAGGPRGRADFTDPQVCADYYVSRLHRLRELGQQHGQRALYFDAECLPRAAEPLLSGVAAWLGLREAPGATYRLGHRSGEAGFGDWSPNIRAGHVLGPAHSTVRTTAPLPATVLAEAEAAYQRCRTSLMQHCATLPWVGAH